jgi:hypothetical protein
VIQIEAIRIIELRGIRELEIKHFRPSSEHWRQDQWCEWMCDPTRRDRDSVVTSELDHHPINGKVAGLLIRGKSPKLFRA